MLPCYPFKKHYSVLSHDAALSRLQKWKHDGVEQFVADTNAVSVVWRRFFFHGKDVVKLGAPSYHQK